MRIRHFLLPALLAAGALAGCGDRFSPDTYATRAVQQADKVEQGIIVGVRAVRISAEGSTGAATGAAAGGVIGAQAPAGGIVSALGGVGGALVGGLIGKGAEHTIVDTNAYEYIVRTTKNELMRVTQQDQAPLRRGQQVLLITGVQARIVPDYTLSPDRTAPEPPAAATAAATPPAADAPAAVEVTPLSAPPGQAGGADPPAGPAEAVLIPAYPSVPPPPPAAPPAAGGDAPRTDAGAAGVDTSLTHG